MAASGRLPVKGTAPLLGSTHGHFRPASRSSPSNAPRPNISPCAVLLPYADTLAGDGSLNWSADLLMSLSDYCSLFVHLGTSRSLSGSMTPEPQAGVPKRPQPLSAACSLAEVRIALAIAVALAMSHAGRIPSIRKDRYVCSGAIGRLPAKSNQLLGRHHPITSVRERVLGLSPNPPKDGLGDSP